MNNKKHIILPVIVLIVIFISCLCLYSETEDKYTIAKGDVAFETIQKLRANPFDHNPKVDTYEVDKIETERKVYTFGMVVSAVSVIGLAIYKFLNSESN